MSDNDNFDFEGFFSGNQDIKPDAGHNLAVVPDDQQIKVDASLLLKRILDNSPQGRLSDENASILLAVAPDLVDYAVPDLAKQSDNSLIDAVLSPELLLYLFLVDSGLSPHAAANAMRVSRSMPAIWRKQNKLFDACYKLILSSLADEAEAKTAQLATTDDRASIERMFFIKAHKPIYRDNAPMPAVAAIKLDITIGNQQIDTTVGLKSAGSDDEQDASEAL